MNTNAGENTPKNVMLGAGIVVSGLAYSNGWTYNNVFGATNGGSTFKIEPNIVSIEADGVLVKVEGYDVKMGEKATLETNLIEIKKENLLLQTLGKAGSGNTEFDEIVSQSGIPAGAYVEDLAFIGETATGDPIVIQLDKALCTSGLELGSDNAKQGKAMKTTFECVAPKTQEGFDTLPWHIFTKKKV